MKEYMEHLFGTLISDPLQSLNNVSVCLALVTFLVGLAVDAIWKIRTPLQDHLGRAVAAGAVPSAIILIVAGFDVTILSKVPGLNVPIAFGGMSLLYVPFKAAIRKYEYQAARANSREQP